MANVTILNRVFVVVAILGFLFPVHAVTISGMVSFLGVSNCCAEGLSSYDGMMKVQVVNSQNKVETAYILPSTKNFNQMLALLTLAQSTSQVVTIDAGLVNNQNTISAGQPGMVYLGVLK